MSIVLRHVLPFIGGNKPERLGVRDVALPGAVAATAEVLIKRLQIRHVF
jgi:hypothetical protein